MSKSTTLKSTTRDSLNSLTIDPVGAGGDIAFVISSDGLTRGITFANRDEFFEAVRNLGAAVFDDNDDLPKVERGESVDGPWVRALGDPRKRRIYAAYNVERLRREVLADIAVLRELEREPLPEETEARRLAEKLQQKGVGVRSGNYLSLARKLVAEGVRVSEP